MFYKKAVSVTRLEGHGVVEYILLKSAPQKNHLEDSFSTQA